MLTDKIRLLTTDPSIEQEPEDILSSSLAVIFPDDITNQHGDAGSSVIYLSPSYGEIVLSLADPQGEDSRGLFSHFLWNAGLLLGELIEEFEGETVHAQVEDEAGEDKVLGSGIPWDVQGQRVLELGAGTGLAGMVSALKGANEVVMSDYPAPEVLDNIKANVRRNIEPRRETPDGKRIATISVRGHEWGVLNDDFSLQDRASFSRILVADCLWMPWQHANLLRSISWFLEPRGRAWVVAGFHTGREKMRGFFEEEGVKGAGLEIERIWERNAEGFEREWVVDRGIEDVTVRKRWLVIAVLRKISCK